MGRWTQYDEDSTRLPEGMERIGYDSDTGRYYFRDRDGSVWQGAQGAEFSEMTRASDGAEANASSSSPEEDIEAAPRRSDGYQALPTNTNGRITSNAGAYRTLFPFFLLIGVVLLLIWRLVLSPVLTEPQNPCPTDATRYMVQPGDSCWEISRTHGCTLDELEKMNLMLNCDRLMPGTTVCLPNVATTPA